MSHGGDDELEEEHEEHVNHEAWVIPYADLLTLLMAMFIALFAMSTVDISKFKSLAIGFNEALGGGKLDASIGGSGKTTSPVVGAGQGVGPFQGGTLAPNDANQVSSKQLASILTALATNSIAKQQQQQSLAQIAKEIEAAAAKGGFGSKLQLKQENRGLVVSLLTDKVLFDSGQADLRDQGKVLLTIVGTALTGIDNPILIDGYTDNVPIRSAQFPSNLYLSLFRAGHVSEFFQSLGIDAGRLNPEGRGDLDPVASNATADGRAKNRRVEIIVQSKLVKKTLEQQGLDANLVPTTPTTKPVAPPVSGPAGGATPNLSPALGAK